jgi:hypothetical protein
VYMEDPKGGWVQPGERRWYHYVAMAIAYLVVGVVVLVLALVVFFMLIAGW